RGESSRFQLSFSNVSTAFCVFIVLALLYSLLNTQYIYLAPEVSSMTYMNPDKGYHLGLINSLSAGWPLESPWVQGRVIHYHIFTEMLYSIPLRLFGIPSDVLLLTCGPYMTIYVFSLSLYALFKEFTSNHKRTGLYCLALMLSNIFIAKGLNRSLAFFFVFRNENATAYGISCFMAVLIIVKYWFEKYQAKEKSWNFFLLVLPLVMLVTGLKGPMGLVIIAAIWGTYVLGIILRKVPLRTILPILIVTAGFLIIYVFILGSKGQTNGGGNSIFALATIVDVCFYKSSVVALLKGFGLPTIVRLAVLLVIFMIFTLTAFIIPFTVGYIREFVLVVLGKKEFGFAQVMVYAACLAGFAAMFIMNYSGHSQVYFGYAAVFMAPLVSFRFFEDMEGNHHILVSLVRGIFIGMLILTSCTLFSYYKDNVAEAEITLNDATDENRYE
ncbi:MAG: hypothetical protein HUJ79_07480, partial [Firmicutes bacterium]|nr:hypothetical protein [Bacillota bacterium]